MAIYFGKTKVANGGIPVGIDNTPTENSANLVTSGTVYSAIKELQEIAQGKTKTFVISYANNTAFNSDDTYVTVSGSLTDVSNNNVNVGLLKIGDIVLVTETGVPDRYVGRITTTETSGGTTYAVDFYKMETQKFDVTDFSKTGHKHTVSDITDYVSDLTARFANYVETTDARLTDARTPKAHNHTVSDITDYESDITTKLASYVKGVDNTKVEVSTTNGNIKINGVEKTVYTLPDTAVKINSISVNSTAQTIDVNKNVNITVPTKTSDLTNDKNFVTKQELFNAIFEYDPVTSTLIIKGI